MHFYILCTCLLQVWVDTDDPYRQRQITDNSTVFSLAQKMLPRELLQELRMHPMQKLKKGDRKRKRMETIAEEEE